MKLLSKILGKTEQLYDKKIDATGLAIFRIAYSVVLLCDVCQTIFFEQLIFDRIPYIVPSEIDARAGLIIWSIALIFHAVGLFTRPAAIVSYVLTVVYWGTIREYSYHMYHVYLSVNFILMFVNSSEALSIDNIIKKTQHSNSGANPLSTNKVSVLNYYIVILLGLGFVYFDSIFHKSLSIMWRSGLGVWMPASVPPVIHSDLSFFLNQKWLMIVLGYLTLLFEFILIFVFMIKSFRIPLVIIGIGLHFGILIIYPIPWFALSYICLYFLLIPVVFWQKLAAVFKRKRPAIFIFYNEESSDCIKTKIVLESLDIRRALSFKGVQSLPDEEAILTQVSRHNLLTTIHTIDAKGKVATGINAYLRILSTVPVLNVFSLLFRLPGFYQLARLVYQKIVSYKPVPANRSNSFATLSPNSVSPWVKQLNVRAVLAGILLLVFIQMLCTYNSPLLTAVKQKTGFERTAIGYYSTKFARLFRLPSRVFLGITAHGVFVDAHFKGYNHIVAIQHVNPNGTKTFLPIINEKGMTDSYIYGPTYAKWTFHANNANVKMHEMESGIRDFTSFWIHKKDMSLNSQKFIVLVKRIDTPGEWEKDFLKKQIAKPWKEAGYAEWQNGKFYSNIQNIETF